MTKMLDPRGSPAHTPTTTAKLARRMLCASRVVADCLPFGFSGSPGLDILLALHVAEEEAQYPHASDLTPPTSLAPSITRRWIHVLEQHGLIDRRDDMLALSVYGHTVVTDLLEKIYAVQRSLD
jgi:hypothetical protein